MSPDVAINRRLASLSLKQRCTRQNTLGNNTERKNQLLDLPVSEAVNLLTLSQLSGVFAGLIVVVGSPLRRQRRRDLKTPELPGASSAAEVPATNDALIAVTTGMAAAKAGAPSGASPTLRRAGTFGSARDRGIRACDC